MGALFRLAFAAAPPSWLNLAADHNSLAHYAKGTWLHMGQAPAVLPLLLGDRVSGTISLPLTGCFSPFPHGTGTLSVSGEYLALEDGPPSFTQDFTCPELLRIPPGWARGFRLRGYNPLWPDFSDRSPIPATSRCWRSYNPGRTNPPVWALPRSLAATWGISFDFCSYGY